MAEEAKTDGQTSTISSQIDCSKLQSLANLDTVLVKQPFRGKECFIQCLGCEVKNLYTIQRIDSSSKQVTPLFTLQEESDCCMRIWYVVYFPRYISCIHPILTLSIYSVAVHKEHWY